MKIEDRSSEAPSYVVMPEDLPSDGIDRTLIRYALRLTPAERLEQARGMADSLGDIADAAEASRRSQGP